MTGQTEQSEQKQEEDIQQTVNMLRARLLTALREVQAAEVEVACPNARNILQEIELFIEEKLEQLMKGYKVR